MDTPTLISIVTTSISTLGFPIVLTGYLLLRFEKKIEKLNNTIMEMLQIIRDEVLKKK
ncbi:YvrJ family protein [Paenibacillus sp. FA6]|uniref:YvrJ family protein n=1 Tax=Paenibacillus sp. FA6 TaxID=3413029 RepID=UPI003F660B91